MKMTYPGVIGERFGVGEDNGTVVILEQIAVKRGCLKKGNEPDYDKAARILLDEFRAGKLGKITLEMP